jgi:ParB family transcriptional regulator, chromosome partitioning protein
MTRKALGRGLGALLSADTLALADEASFVIDTDLIDPNPVQPRSHFDEGNLEDLARSIRENGVVQPLLVRRKGPRFELVAGERRWRAAKLAGLQRVPAVVRDVADEKLLELALIENIQREDLSAIEEAHAYKSLIETIGLTQETLASRVGRDRSYITNHIRLLRLPEDLQRLVQEGKLSGGHARTLLGINDINIQRRVARRIIEKRMSVRETEGEIRRLSASAGSGATKRSAGVRKDPNVRAAEAKLRHRLGTRVRVLQDTEGTGGRVEIEYDNQEGLDRLYVLLMEERTNRP